MAVDLVNNYSVGGHTRHKQTRQYFDKFKEQGVMVATFECICVSV